MGAVLVGCGGVVWMEGELGESRGRRGLCECFEGSSGRTQTAQGWRKRQIS